MRRNLEQLDQKHIDAIVQVFQSAGVWNNGKFADGVETYCKENNLDSKVIHERLEIAFRDYLATNISSENAIKFRLSQITIPKNAAL